VRVRGDTAVQCRIARLRITNGQPRPASTVRRRVDPRVIDNVQPVALPATTTPTSSTVFCWRETRLESSSTTNAYTSWQANWQMFVCDTLLCRGAFSKLHHTSASSSVVKYSGEAVCAPLSATPGRGNSPPPSAPPVSYATTFCNIRQKRSIVVVSHTPRRHGNSHAISRITQCYLPPGRADISALTPAEASTRLSDPGGMQG